MPPGSSRSHNSVVKSPVAQTVQIYLMSMFEACSQLVSLHTACCSAVISCTALHPASIYIVLCCIIVLCCLLRDDLFTDALPLPLFTR